jgi:putative tricarboxylic transport membrane protein
MKPVHERLGVFARFTSVPFVAVVFAGSVAGLFVGAIPGLSVTMATALLVSISYSWSAELALGMVMGVYVVGVYSGAISAILINIPGAPSSVVTTLDGYPLARRGESGKALKYAAVYSFVGSVFGFAALWAAARPITAFALKFRPMDYFLLAFFGLTAVGSLTSKNPLKGFASACFGLLASMVGIDSVVGTPRLTFGVYDLAAGIGVVPALVGLFGFSEVLTVIANAKGSIGKLDSETLPVQRTIVYMKDIVRHWALSLYCCVIGTIVGALPGAGGPVASFLAYGEARRIVKKPAVPFGEGAVEGIVASESANNACIGGALIPMLTLAVPGDSVTAIILSVFYVHGLRPGPMFLRNSPEMFHTILAGGFFGCVFLLVLGLLVGPKISRVIAIPKRLLLPAVTVLCVVGAFAGNNRMFDVLIMFCFGVAGFVMRRRGYPVAPATLGLVLGGMMDSEFRRAVSLAVSEDNLLAALFGRPITIVLLVLIVVPFAYRAMTYARVQGSGFRV